MTKRVIPSNQLTETMQRVATYYTELAETESAKGLEGYHNLDIERTQLLVVLEGCHQQGEWDAAVQRLAGAVDGYLFMQGHMTERNTLLETGIEAARQAGNQYNEAVFLDKLASNHYSMGRVTEAIALYEQALVINRELGNRNNEGADLGNLGLAYSDLGQVYKAIEFYEQAQLIDREIGNRRGEGANLGNLGSAYYSLGQVDKAIEFYQQALLIAREMGDRRGESNHVGNLGLAYRALGQMKKAMEFYQKALLISREIGDRHGEGTWLHNLGNLYKEQGWVTLARQHLQQSLAIFEAIKSPEAVKTHRLLQALDTPLEKEKVQQKFNPPYPFMYVNPHLREKLDEATFMAFQQATNGKEAMYEVAVQFPIMRTEQFWQTVEEFINEQVPKNYKRSFKERIYWLKNMTEADELAIRQRLEQRKQTTIAPPPKIVPEKKWWQFWK